MFIRSSINYYLSSSISSISSIFSILPLIGSLFCIYVTFRLYIDLLCAIGYILDIYRYIFLNSYGIMIAFTDLLLPSELYPDLLVDCDALLDFLEELLDS